MDTITGRGETSYYYSAITYRSCTVQYASGYAWIAELKLEIESIALLDEYSDATEDTGLTGESPPPMTLLLQRVPLKDMRTTKPH